jgi:hypothetical protein
MNIAAEKEQIIARLSAIEDENMIIAIKAMLDVGTQVPAKSNVKRTKLSDAQVIAKYSKPLKKTIDIEALKKERNYVAGKEFLHRGEFFQELSIYDIHQSREK